MRWREAAVSVGLRISIIMAAWGARALARRVRRRSSGAVPGQATRRTRALRNSNASAQPHLRFIWRPDLEFTPRNPP